MSAADPSPSAAAPPLAVFDLDGTLADTRHRAHHLAGAGDWTAFFDAAPRDPLLAEGAAAVRAAVRAGCRVVYLSGRPERLRQSTLTWLAQHELPPGHLILRPDASRVPATAYKLTALRRMALREPLALLVDDDRAGPSSRPRTAAGW